MRLSSKAPRRDFWSGSEVSPQIRGPFRVFASLKLGPHPTCDRPRSAAANPRNIRHARRRLQGWSVGSGSSIWGVGVTGIRFLRFYY